MSAPPAEDAAGPMLGAARVGSGGVPPAVPPKKPSSRRAPPPLPTPAPKSHRGMVVAEVFQTEASYGASLDAVMALYVEPLRARPDLIRPDEVSTYR